MYAFLGVLLTYGTTAAIVLLLPEPFKFSCANQIHRANFAASRPYLRVRTWNAPYGTYFQIHITSPRAVGMYLDLDSLTPAQRTEAVENPKITDATVIPVWSRVRRDWPNSLITVQPFLDRREVWVECLMGWPLPCLYGSFRTDIYEKLRGSDQMTIPFTRKYASSGPFSKVLSAVALPLMPVWMPFAADVTFYGLLTYGAVSAWRAMKRRRRQRRGLCAECGYDLRASPNRCPECGTMVTRIQCKPGGHDAA